MIKLTLKQRIMSGVYLLYLVRRMKTPLVVESLIFIIVASVLFYFVSIPSFVSNMFESGNFFNYFIMAFSNTDFLVQTALVLALITAVFFVRNITVHAILKNRLA